MNEPEDSEEAGHGAQLTLQFEEAFRHFSMAALKLEEELRTDGLEVSPSQSVLIDRAAELG